MRRLFVLFLVLMACTGCNRVETGGSGSDLEDYIARIRAQKMSEGARGNLYSVAVVHLGHSTLDYVRTGEDGKHWPSWHSNTCPSPTATQEERKARARELQAEQDAIMPAIIAVADADGSGFVSTAEAWKFRQVYEFGHEFAFVRDELDGDWSRMGGKSNMTEEDLRERVEEYNEIAEKVAAGGVRLMTPIEF